MPFSKRFLLILALGAAASCGGRHPDTAPSPSAPQATVDGFLAAVNANDLDAMALLWGDEDGPSSVTHKVRGMPQRLTIMQRVLRSDGHEVVATDVADPQHPKLSVQLARGDRRVTLTFVMARSRYGGWLLREIPNFEAAMPAAGSAPR